ncbi:MAG: hypothetical protein EXX96DRAFT_621443 [Benjaminiella poitrasii]|nr:MAG: hypothetical protein EXX96DRAFT_621443 [Benjaminiella poitrasii]
MESFKLDYDGDDSVMRYFSEHPVSEWSYFEFEAAINKNKPIKPNEIKTKNAYLNAMKNVINDYDIPEDSSGITFNISAKDSSTVNAIGNGVLAPIQKLQPQQPEPQQGSKPQPQPQPQDENEEYGSDESETRIPSDLSIDHHPRRTNDYFLSFQEGSTQLEEDPLEKDSANNSKWILNNQCISDLCFELKNTTLQITKQYKPAQLSDSRLLVLNDIYLFDKNLALSVSIQCYDWCMNIEASPPSDWLSSLKLCGKIMTDACESNNLLDIHTAQVLIHVLPIFINGPPDYSIEDSYVHNFLSPLLAAVFGSDSLLHMKWANGQLKNNDSKVYKPDFLVYNLSGSVKHVVVVSEFKAADQNSYVESDLVKLAKQMRLTMNELVLSGVVEPKVCGIHCEGNSLHTYVMDLISPKVYRMISVAKLKLFGDLAQITCLPSILTHLMCLKNIAHESALKIETAVVSTCANLKRPAPCPPLYWLSKDFFVLSRATKKLKK